MFIQYLSSHFFHSKKKSEAKEILILEQKIKHIFYGHKSIYGRDRITVVLWQKHALKVSYKTVGHYMKALNLRCITRQKLSPNYNIRQAKKNLKKNIIDLVKGDFQGKNIIATDTTYIAINDKHSKFAYLFIAINHNTKYIEKFIISTNK